MQSPKVFRLLAVSPQPVYFLEFSNLYQLPVLLFSLACTMMPPWQSEEPGKRPSSPALPPSARPKQRELAPCQVCSHHPDIRRGSNRNRLFPPHHARLNTMGSCFPTGLLRIAQIIARHVAKLQFYSWGAINQFSKEVKGALLGEFSSGVS